MALMTRVSRLLRADVHAVLDRLEEPDVLLQQAIRDMEEVIADLRNGVNLNRKERQQLRRRSEDVTQRASDLSQQLDAALSAGNEEVARGVVRRQLECKAFKATMDERMENLVQDISRQESVLSSHESELAALKQKAEILTESGESSSADRMSPSAFGAITDDEVEAALIREVERRKSQ